MLLDDDNSDQDSWRERAIFLEQFSRESQTVYVLLAL